MQALSLIGIFIALGLIFYGSMKSITPIILAPIAALIVALTSGLNLSEVYAVTYMTGLGNFVRANFPIFLTGALFGKFLEVSGLCHSISKAIIGKFGSSKAILAMALASVALSIAGISAFVLIFTLYPMSVVLFREADIPREIIPAALIGPSISASILPGLPSLYNGMASTHFKTTVAAAPITGFVMGAVALALCLLYLTRTVKKLKDKGLHYELLESDKKYFTEMEDKAGMPNPFLALIPVLVTLILLNVVRLTVAESLAFGCVVMIIMFFPRFRGKFKPLLDDAIRNSFAIVVTAAIVGFGSVVTTTAGYESVVSFLSRVSLGNPYILAFVSVNIVAAITGSGGGGLTVAMTTVGEQAIAMGANVQSLTRVFIVSCLCFDTMPHNSVVVTSLNACSVKHAQGYKYLFATNALVPTACAAVGIIMSTIGIL